MRLTRLTLAPILLAGCASISLVASAQPAPAQSTSDNRAGDAALAINSPFAAAPLPETTPSDLPRIARPLHYSIEIEPDAAGLSFTGNSEVLLEIYQPTSEITLHSHELELSNATLRNADGEPFLPLALTSSDEQLQTITLSAEGIIAPGTYTIATSYSGTINRQAVGLFALDYPDKVTGEETRGLFTQFEAPDARRFVPSFDEPSYKATFDFSAIVPADQLAVSNMPIAEETLLDNGRKRVAFDTSPIMSTYLLFFALGDFERASLTASNGTQLGIVAPRGSGEQTQFALESMEPIIPWFEDYFGVKYPLPKLDNVTAPGQSQFFSAMENWGAILTFEGILLDDPATSSPSRRQRIYEVQAHEVAHQWFGNIVTMSWWDDLWLNEGFASWLDTKITHHFHPEWQQDLSLVNIRERAMRLDAFENSHPIVQDISTVSELAQAFDGITYSKGQAVIGMLEAYAGEDAWQEGLQLYLARHAYQNTKSSDLWQAMEDTGTSGLGEIAHGFTHQLGVPLIRASVMCENGEAQLSLSQGQFSADNREGAAANSQSWLVPLNIATGTGEQTRHERVVLDGQAQLTHNACGEPIVLNSGQSGYFRTLYGPELFSQITSNFASFEPIDQLGLMRNNFALSGAGYQDRSRPLDLLNKVEGDANPIIAQYSATSWASLYHELDQDAANEAAASQIIAGIAQRKLGPRLAGLGFDPIENEPVVDSNLRATLISSLGGMGDEKIAQEAARRFAMLGEDPRALDGPLKNTWLNIAARNANLEEWGLLRRLAEESSSTVEKQTYYRLLGANENEGFAKEALEFALTGEAGTASAAIIREVSAGHPEMAFAFAIENRDEVRALVDASGWHGYLARLAQGSDSDAFLAQLVDIRDQMDADEAVPLTRTIDSMRVRLENAPKQVEALLNWLTLQED